MKKSENFWNRNAKRYDRFMRKDRAAYEKLYELIRPVVKQNGAGAGNRYRSDRQKYRACGKPHRGDGRLRGNDR